VRDETASSLARWVRLGLITPDQADAIRATEAREAPSGPGLPSGARRVIVSEVLGSLGAIAACASAVVGTAVLWEQLTTTARTAIPAVGAAALFAAGAVVPRGEDRSAQRLGALLWLLATVATGAAMAVLGTDALGLAGQNVALISGAVPLAISIVLLRHFPSPHLVLAVVGASVCTAVGTILQYDAARAAHVGVVLTCLGASLVLLGWSGILPDRSTGVVSAAAVALVGVEMLGDLARHWPIVGGGLLALGLLALFMASRDRASLVSGLAIAIVVVVQGIVQLSGGRRGDGDNRWMVLTIFAAGAGVLAASLVAVRSASRHAGST
jgi:hypothetical protein